MEYTRCSYIGWILCWIWTEDEFKILRREGCPFLLLIMQLHSLTAVIVNYKVGTETGHDWKNGKCKYNNEY